MFSHGIEASQQVVYTTGVTWEGNVQAFLDPNKVIQHCLVETGLAPVMSLYMEGKPLNVSPSVIGQLQHTWADYVGDANALFLIGVKPNIHDTHIWEPLANSKASLYFIGDEKALENWKETSRTFFTEFLGSKFNLAYPAMIRR